MLIEHPCRQIPDDFARRWMSDDYMDLIVWLDPKNHFHGFQLCYDKTGKERALTWVATRGFFHHAVEPGDTNPHANCTPILVADGCMPVEIVRQEFLQRSNELDFQVRELVLAKLEDYGLHQHT